MREALYDALGGAERAAAHTAIGEAIETVYAAELDAFLPALAHHFAQSAGTGELDRAFRYARAAGEQAYAPEAAETAGQGPVARQLLYGCSIDQLAGDGCFAFPTHLKIDVDGLEAAIIDGAMQTLRDPRLKGVLIEINKASARDMAIPGILEEAGFELVSDRSNWLYREDRSREAENPTTNMIFRRN